MSIESMLEAHKSSALISCKSRCNEKENYLKKEECGKCDIYKYYKRSCNCVTVQNN